jgi:hypothetical protein
MPLASLNLHTLTNHVDKEAAQAPACSTPMLLRRTIGVVRTSIRLRKGALK